ncbi:hypothetical protein PMAYCL1PPCAC_01596, partial [Pristionchus mayeri]
CTSQMLDANLLTIAFFTDGDLSFFLVYLILNAISLTYGMFCWKIFPLESGKHRDPLYYATVKSAAKLDEKVADSLHVPAAVKQISTCVKSV